MDAVPWVWHTENTRPHLLLAHPQPGRRWFQPREANWEDLRVYVLPPHFHQGLRDFARKEKQALKTLATNLFPKVVTSFAADYGEVYA